MPLITLKSDSLIYPLIPNHDFLRAVTFKEWDGLHKPIGKSIQWRKDFVICHVPECCASMCDRLLQELHDHTHGCEA